MIKNSLSLILVLAVAAGLQSFQWKSDVNIHQDENSAFAYQLDVTMDGEDFTSIASSIYSKFDFGSNKMDKDVFVRALKGYIYLKQAKELKKESFLTVVDLSLSSKKKRLWVLDMRDKTIVLNELVAHGKNSGNEFATSFSNKAESRQSSLGFYVTGQTYNGKHKYSLKLKGLEAGYNTNAFARGLVIHGANYVNEQIVEAGQRIGRSYGCPAVSQEINATLVEIIKGGSCLFLHHSNKTYLQRSKILNNKLYIPLEVLKKLEG